MKRNGLLTAVLLLGLTAGLTACGEDDEQNGGEKEYVPQESYFMKLARTQDVYSTSCEEGTYKWMYFQMNSNPIENKVRHDYYNVSFCLESDPVGKKESGRYELMDVSARVDGFDTYKEFVKNVLYQRDPTQHPVVGAYVDLQYLGETDEYGYRKYSVKFHADDLVEENGDYARDVTLTYTGYIKGGMLRY